MPNLRIVYNNVAEKATTLTASSTANGLVASNMLTEYKGQVHRSSSTSVVYTITWSTPQLIDCVIMPCTNLSSTAQIRVKLYSDAAGTALIKDSGTVLAVSTSSIETSRWNGILNCNTFAFGGLTKAAIWLSSAVSAKRCIIEVTDTNNLAGYIDNSKLVIGKAWSPKYNLEDGFQHVIVDSSKVVRADSGDSVASIGTVSEGLSFNYTLIPETDRKDLLKIFKTVGIFKNIYIAALPETTMDNDIAVYGKLKQLSYSQKLFAFYSSTAEIESW